MSHAPIEPTEPPGGDSQIDIHRTIAVTPERLFAAWTDPTLVSRWFAPSKEYAVVVHRLDPRPGGDYRIEMRHRNGATHVATGRYTEVTRPERLAFTWRWEDWEGMPETLVTLTFTPAGMATELHLTHTRLDTAELRTKHAQGWTGCLDQLAGCL